MARVVAFVLVQVALALALFQPLSLWAKFDIQLIYLILYPVQLEHALDTGLALNDWVLEVIPPLMLLHLLINQREIYLNRPNLQRQSLLKCHQKVHG